MLDSSISIYKNFQNLPQNIQQKLLEFEQTYKSVEDLPNKFVKDTPTFIFKAMLIHKDKYDYRQSIYTGNEQKIKIICHIHGEFLQRASSHNYNNGCSKCAADSLSKIKSSNNLEFIEKANKIHNNFYDYSKVEYINSSTKIIIICPIHGNFKQTPNAHIIKNEGCPKCSREKRTKTLEEFIEQANKIHNNKYDYSKFVYINTRTDGIIICEKHGDFQQRPAHHLRGCECPKCVIERNSHLRTKTLEEFIKQAKVVHKNSLYEYTYDRFVYKGTRIKGIITCEKHGDFEQTPNSHLNGRGCPLCGDEKNLKHLRNVQNIKWSNRYSEGILYLIECWNDVERFVKIGVTAFSIEKRYRQKNFMPYQYKVLEEIPLDSESCLDYEQHILEICETYKPKITFGGDTECLSFDERYFLQDFLNQFKKSN